MSKKQNITVLNYDVLVPQGVGVSHSGPGCQSVYRSGDLRSYDTPVWGSVVQFLVVRVDIGVVTYEAMTPQCGGQWFRSLLSGWI